MCQALLCEASTWRRLFELDVLEAERVRAGGCSHCDGPLHSAPYRRKPRGVPRALLGVDYAWRLSLCCGREGCRRRTTPASTRFLGRKVYLGAVVVLLCALTNGLSAGARARLAGQFGVSWRTLERWRQWWRSTLPATPWWHAARARFAPPPEDLTLPSSLLACLGQGLDAQTLIGALHFISPCSLSLFPALDAHAA